LNAASAQISNWLGLPSGVASSMADAKAVDAQMGAEKGLSAITAGLAGANMVYESAGMMASLLGASFEAFILDDEMLSAVHRTIRGIEVNEETLGFDAIKDVVLGEGHFLAHPSTMAAMERDYAWPKLANREAPITWAEKGAADIWDRAKQQAKSILADHHPDYLGQELDARLRSRYPIK
jgi:trimethylamine--corrinoid protein Co-methyltransferase